MPTLLRDPAGLWPNAVALLYTLTGYALGVYLIARPEWAANGAGVLLLAHALVYAAYFIHEFAHYTIFRGHALNDAGGVLMSWLTGGCYVPFGDIRNKHLRHHADRVDVVTFDYRTFLARHPRLTRVVLALEWLHLPAVEVLMHGFVLVLPFTSPHAHHRRQRGRVAALLLVRGALFAALAAVAPKAVALYLVAWLLFLAVLRFNDAFQHTYPVVPLLGREAQPEAERPSRDFEQQNTYSNLASLGHPWLNLLVLNFTYHNAHHDRPNVPWYRLPALHRALYGGERTGQVLTWRELLRTFHGNRVRRVLAEEYGEVRAGTGRADAFVGAVGVSFLTSV